MIVTPGQKLASPYLPWVKTGVSVIAPGGKSWLAKSYPPSQKLPSLSKSFPDAVYPD